MLPERGVSHMSVPVGDQMMPTTPACARRWITSGKVAASPESGLFHQDPPSRVVQPEGRQHHLSGPPLPQYPGRSQAEQAATAAIYQREGAVETPGGPFSLPTCPGQHHRWRGGDTTGHTALESRVFLAGHQFYEQGRTCAALRLRRGDKTRAVGNQPGLRQTSRNLAEVWQAHCVKVIAG
jgi:hypothetical protein